jgi:hypothetical protein
MPTSGPTRQYAARQVQPKAVDENNVGDARQNKPDYNVEKIMPAAESGRNQSKQER